MAERPEHFFTTGQRAVVVTSITTVASLVLLTAAVGVFLLLREFIAMFSSVIWPLALAGMLALLIRPVVVFFQTKFRLAKIPSILAVYVLALVVLALAAALILPQLIKQISSLVSVLPDLFDRSRSALDRYAPDLFQVIEQHFGKENFTKIIDGGMQSLQQVLGESASFLLRATDSVLSVVGFVASAAIVPVYLFYLLETDRNLLRDLHQQLTFIKPRWRDDLVFLVREFTDILVAFFRGQILIGVLLGVILAIGLSAVGLQFGLILGLLIGLLNIVPYLGTIIGIVTLVPVALFQEGGGWLLFGLVAAVFVIGQLVNDYYLTPKIMGSSTGLHPMVIIISIFFWGVAFNGILGMILAIPLTAFFVVFWRLARVKYLPHFETDAV